MENLSILPALLITAIGMGLVFLGLALLWFLMTLLVRFSTSRRSGEGDEQQTPGVEDATSIGSLEDIAQERRRTAAVVAVAYALGQQADATQPHEFPLPPPALVSAWQAVLRTRMINKQRQPR